MLRIFVRIVIFVVLAVPVTATFAQSPTACKELATKLSVDTSSWTEEACQTVLDSLSKTETGYPADSADWGSSLDPNLVEGSRWPVPPKGTMLTISGNIRDAADITGKSLVVGGQVLATGQWKVGNISTGLKPVYQVWYEVSLGTTTGWAAASIVCWSGHCPASKTAAKAAACPFGIQSGASWVECVGSGSLTVPTGWQLIGDSYDVPGTCSVTKKAGEVFSGAYTLYPSTEPRPNDGNLCQ